MTVCCESCKSPENVNCGSSPCSSHPFTVETHRGICKRFRSTKGASKVRRDQINGEIRSMRTLLPISREDQERLSYLHSMSVICTYIRKTVFLQGLTAGQGPECCLPYEDFLSALSGFILVLTSEGRLLYVSENVSEYLGHSMVDVLQGDSFYDMVESPDIEAVKSNLELDTTSSTERRFVCRMHTSKAFRLQHGSCASMLVRGRYRTAPLQSSSDQRVFVALCTPTVNRLRSSDAACAPDCFTSAHKADMAFTRLSDSVLFYLGYSAEEMIGRSWYSLVHPDDLSLSACSHKNLMQADEGSQVEMVLRLQSKDLTWPWVYIRATKDSGDQGISCTNYIISETEASYLRQKIHCDAFSPRARCPSPPSLPAQTQGDCPSRCPKRQREPSGQCEEPIAKISRGSESGVYYRTCTSLDGGSPVAVSDGPSFFSTPPYSPASSHSPPQQEDASSDFLLDVYGYAEQLLSSPESSPPYYCYPEAASHPGPGHLSPSPAHEQTYDQTAFAMSVAYSPDSCPSPAPYDYPVCAVDARLVPDCLPVLEVCESTADCALHPEDLCPLPVEPQAGVASFQVRHVPQGVPPPHMGLLTPDPSPTSAELSFQYSEMEQVEISILAQQISSLASSFDMYHMLSPVQSQCSPECSPPPACDWPQPPAHSPVLAPLKPQLVLDEGVFDSILKELDIVPGREATAPLSFGYQQGPGHRLEVSQEIPSLVQQHSGLSLSSLVDSLPMEQFTSATLDPLSDLRAGCHDQHTELHQLDHYLLSSLQQDGLIEESMY